MRLRTLHIRSLSYHWRTNVGVVLGVAVGTAVLAGALIVGDSMRGSLRDAALGRLGRVDHALVASRFFREALAADLQAQHGASSPQRQVHGVILLAGGAVHATTRARENRITVLGVDEGFWNLRGKTYDGTAPNLTGRSVVLNKPLADDLGAKVGEDILVYIAKRSAISTETLLGRRDDTSTTLRLTVTSVIAGEDTGAFTLNPRQFLPRNAYVSLATLQRALDQRDRVNALLVACEDVSETPPYDPCRDLQEQLSQQIRLEDMGLSVRAAQPHGYVVLESTSMLIPPVIEAAVMDRDDSINAVTSGVQTYLANSIAKESTAPNAESNSHVIPYSTVAAIDPAGPTAAALALTSGDSASTLQPGDILLNEWAADDLDARPGDRITLSFYVTGEFGRLETRTESFTLCGVVALRGAAADRGFTPEYKGVTDTRNLADWDPPFPMDLSLIRDKDEEYWDKHRATPKAFISLEDGLRLWAHDADRFGRLTSIRIYPNVPDADLTTVAEAFERSLIQRIEPAQLGLSFEPVREQMLQAGKGSTDFGMLFIGFSFFLIASAAMLVGLLFRLSVEQRAAEIGLKLSVGFSSRDVGRHALIEGAALASIGCALGTAASIGYGWLMLAGLRTWWADAVNTPFLRLHLSASTLTIGFVAGFLVALASITWSIRSLLRLSARSLLAGSVAAARPDVTRRSATVAKTTAGTAFAIAIAATVSPMITDTIPQSLAFFLGGAAMMVSGLSFFASRLRGEPHSVIDRPGRAAFWQLGIRNARRRTGRSILTASLIASATFLVAALEAFHLDAGDSENDRGSGTGGFALYAESSVPLIYDLDAVDGRESLGLPSESNEILRNTSIIPFRLRPGDESSCVNLYQPTNPRILGATNAVIERGGFAFTKTLAKSEEERANPWTLLDRTFPDGAVPVIGDESAVLWQFHLGLGKDLVVTNERGKDVRLRFVALLGGSMLQDELIVAESHFVQMFPSIGGHAFFLIDVAAESSEKVESLLELELTAFGFDVGITQARLADYLAVQNTYLSTFQSLGGLGLLLGSIGLGAVLLRNVWERRSELALMRAVGYSRAAIGYVVMAENVALLLIGLSTGLVSALIAIAPHIVHRPSTIPWFSVGLILMAVLATGLFTGAMATMAALRAPLIPSLRAE